MCLLFTIRKLCMWQMWENRGVKCLFCTKSCMWCAGNNWYIPRLSILLCYCKIWFLPFVHPLNPSVHPDHPHACSAHMRLIFRNYHQELLHLYSQLFFKVHVISWTPKLAKIIIGIRYIPPNPATPSILTPSLQLQQHSVHSLKMKLTTIVSRLIRQWWPGLQDLLLKSPLSSLHLSQHH